MAISIFEISNFVEDDFGYREIVSYKRATDARQRLLSVQPGLFLLPIISVFFFEVVGTALPCYHHHSTISNPVFIGNRHIYNTWVVCLLMK